MSDFVKDVCRIVGHDLTTRATNNPTEMSYIIGGRCSRCNEENIVRIKYNEIQGKKFAIFQRAKERLQEAFKKRQA